MTRKDKDLLFKYLCMALPYGVICDIYNEISTIKEKLLFGGIKHFADDSICVKPYLRPMSSMTQEEATEYANCGNIIAISPQNDYLIPNPKSINWLLEHHFDFMGLIPKDLAIEVTKENNPYKE